jgi:hypothetical protein
MNNKGRSLPDRCSFLGKNNPHGSPAQGNMHVTQLFPALCTHLGIFPFLRTDHPVVL